MKNLKILIVLSVLIATPACQKDYKTDCQEATNDGRVCNKIYQPVCGCNNKTYGNSCEAESFGITSYTQGVCK